MKLFFGDKQLNENSILKCTEVMQMKKNSAVEIAKDMMSREDYRSPEELILCQAVIDANSVIGSHCMESEIGDDEGVYCLGSSEEAKDWLKQYGCME